MSNSSDHRDDFATLCDADNPLNPFGENKDLLNGFVYACQYPFVNKDFATEDPANWDPSDCSLKWVDGK